MNVARNEHIPTGQKNADFTVEENGTKGEERLVGIRGLVEKNEIEEKACIGSVK